MRRFCLLAFVAVLLGVAAPQAHAYRLDPDAQLWNTKTITYHVANPQLALAARRATQAWNNVHANIRFVPVKRVSQARVLIRLVSSYSPCQANASIGMPESGPGTINAGPSCGPYNEVLILTHEFGHVLGLDHEFHACAAMNDGPITTIGRYAHPSQCPAGRQWWKTPVTPNDAEGVRAMYLHRQGLSTKMPYVPGHMGGPAYR